MSRLLGPIEPLLARLTKSWGAIGETGDLKEIKHTCNLISEAIERCVAHEERLYFSIVPEEFENLKELMVDAMGSQAQKLRDIPSMLDDALALASSQADEPRKDDEPTIIQHTIEFSLPDEWVEQVEREHKKAVKLLSQDPQTPQNSGCTSALMWIMISFLIVIAVTVL